jgi:hypothetical protein
MPSALPVIVSFAPSPSTISPGGNATLAWNVTGADTLNLDPGIGAVSGSSRSVSPASTTTYALTATNTAGSRTAHATVTITTSTGSGIIIDHTCTNLSLVPSASITVAKNTLKIAYGHTRKPTHHRHGCPYGGQCPVFMERRWNFRRHEDRRRDPGWRCGVLPRLNTRSYLGTPNTTTGRGTSHSDVNVIIWSWCGQAASRTAQEMIDTYLTPMAQLEADYPGIRFVYMTGHLDGSGSGGNLNQRNEQLRAFCRANNKVLFDFADIESFDPSGTTNFMTLSCDDGCNYDSDGNGSRDQNWADVWIATHATDSLALLANSCGDCAHSQRMNCILKARSACLVALGEAGRVERKLDCDGHGERPSGTVFTPSVPIGKCASVPIPDRYPEIA